MRKALMEKRKKDNKGFSLVELIVVVLIIAIISVSLAPQVMKWVGTSKENVDENNRGTIKSAVSAAVADFMTDCVDSPEAKFVINGKPETDVMASDDAKKNYFGNAYAQIIEVMDGEWPETKSHKRGFEVEITSTGQVTVTYVAAPTT